MLEFVKTVNGYLSDYILVVLLVGTGIFFTFKTRFVQVRCFKEGIKQVFGGISKKSGKGEMNSFQALATAIAAQVGTGNIVGVSGAILTGGPGALFWMWIISFFSMATIYAEAILAQETKQLMPDGSVAGGPVYYIKKAFPGPLGKFLCGFFAVATVIALGFIGTMVQSNSIAESFSGAFNVPAYIIGIVVAVISSAVFFGDVKRIASVTEKLVPFMALLYIAGGIVVLIVRIKYLPEAFALIFRYAFRPDAIIGGGIGYAIKTALSQGVKRGLFSNEAGMGSTPHAHAVAKVEKPHDQGVAAMIGVFIDSFVILTMTGLVIVSTLYTKGGILEKGLVDGVSKTNVAALSFATVIGQKGASAFIAICLLLFAFSTIISWNYFGKINFEYLFGSKARPVYFLLSIVFVFLGSILSSDLAWECADLFNQLMVIPNVLAIVYLSSIVKANAKNNK